MTDLFTHHIRTSDEIPVRAKPYPVPYSLRVHLNVDLHHEVQEMLDTGIIRESRSPNASPVVVVKKKKMILSKLFTDITVILNKTVIIIDLSKPKGFCEKPVVLSHVIKLLTI